MTMKSAITAILASLTFTGAAQALDKHVLHSAKDWQVELVNPGGGIPMWCDASAVYYYGNTEAHVSVSAHYDADLRLQFWHPAWDFGETERTVIWSVDHKAAVAAPATFFRQSIFVKDHAALQPMLADIAAGNTLHLIGPFGDPVFSWPLAGSRAALDVLEDCAGKIQHQTYEGVKR